MERSLDPDLIRLALGPSEGLPGADELISLIADAEIGLLLNRGLVSDELVAVAWYLHSVGSTLEALELYGTDRQRAALQVAGHIFDLALQRNPLDELARFEYTFAAQIAYLRSEFQPNALAVYRRGSAGRLPRLDVVESPALTSLVLGVALLGLDSDYLFPELRAVRAQLRDLDSGFDGIEESPFATTDAVVAGVSGMHVFLVYGDRGRLDAAIERLVVGVRNEASDGDFIGKWVAAHLATFGDGLTRSSIWTALPPDVPASARRAFARGAPRIATLWPPQLDVLGAESSFPNPFSTDVRRLLLSMPTSAGKTLLSQLIIAVHLARGRGGVCYIAPTRSLCREVRQSLDRRLRYLDVRVGVDLPEFTQYEDVDVDPPVVEVMTPERLSFLLRQDASTVLDRFTLFVFDEVHTVSDPSRGWTLETLLTFVNTSTNGADHTVIAMSAALGNQSQIAAWLGTDMGPATSYESSWRGPRRLHCIWTTTPDRSKEHREARRSATRSVRIEYPLHGTLHARVGRGRRMQTLTTTESIGLLSLSATAHGGDRQRESSRSTPFYRMLVPAIEFLAALGPVLVVESTKRLAMDLASAVAADRSRRRQPNLAELRDFMSARLGEAHPLTSLVSRGVAYHHGSLPLDVRGAVEDGLRDGSLDVLVATTSLTEGVNLPVRSVLVGSQGRAWGDDEGRDYISGPRLLNAVGRAGRAAIETEGVVVLARAASFSVSDFDRLDPDPEDLLATSALASLEALRELAALEAAIRASENAIFQVATGAAGGFVSFVWFLLSELERLNQEIDAGQVAEFLRRTLAWQQLDESDQRVLLSIAEGATAAFGHTPSARRGRWARSGAPIAVARTVDDISDALAVLDISDDDVADPVGLLLRVLEDGRLEALLGLPDAPSPTFRTRRGGGVPIAVDYRELLRGWLGGAELPELAERVLSDVPDPAFRVEQTADAISDVFETHLPWCLGLAISWANTKRLDDEELLLDPDLPPELTAYLRWGVDSVEALRLMGDGVQSRRLAHRIFQYWRARGTGDDVLAWLRGQSVAEWRRFLRPTPGEFRNLLDILRLPGMNVLSRVLSGEEVAIELSDLTASIAVGTDGIFPVDDSIPPLLGVAAANEIVATIPTSHQADVQALRETGLQQRAWFPQTGRCICPFGCPIQIRSSRSLVTPASLRHPSAVDLVRDLGMREESAAPVVAVWSACQRAVAHDAYPRIAHSGSTRGWAAPVL